VETIPADNPLDTHCHIDLYPDPAGVVREMASRRCRGIAVTNAPFVFSHTKKLVAACPGLEPALGLHPELAVERSGELDLFRALLPQTRFVGEVGLDYVTRDQQVRALQRRIFGDILAACAEAGDKILTIHSRRAVSDVITAIGDKFRGRAILHWFSGTLKELDRAQSFGFCFSVNPSMTGNKSGQALIRQMDSSRVLTETDGPFLQVRGVAAKPWQVTECHSFLASLWGCTPAEAAVRVNENYVILTRPGEQ
jgi:TatD DNase family protein